MTFKSENSNLTGKQGRQKIINENSFFPPDFQLKLLKNDSNKSTYAQFEQARNWVQFTNTYSRKM